jgi:hypothetical protein
LSYKKGDVRQQAKKIHPGKEKGQKQKAAKQTLSFFKAPVYKQQVASKLSVVCNYGRTNINNNSSQHI